MKTWRWIVLAACGAAVVILAGSSLLEAHGSFDAPWIGRLSARLSDRRWSPPGNYAFVEANPYVNAAAGLVSQYLVGVLVVLAAPRLVRRLADAMQGGTRPLARYLITGILLAAVLVAVALLSTLYIHLFPLPIVLVFGFFLSALCGVVALEFEIGRGLLRRAGWPGASPLAALALGCLLVFAASRIPFLGPLFLALVWLMGAGVVLATRFGSGGRWSLSPLQEESQA
jgi:hypothetical protein